MIKSSPSHPRCRSARIAGVSASAAKGGRTDDAMNVAAPMTPYFHRPAPDTRMPKDTIMVIPGYNEGRMIGRTLASVRKAGLVNAA